MRLAIQSGNLEVDITLPRKKLIRYYDQRIAAADSYAYRIRNPIYADGVSITFIVFHLFCFCYFAYLANWQEIIRLFFGYLFYMIVLLPFYIIIPYILSIPLQIHNRPYERAVIALNVVIRTKDIIFKHFNKLERKNRISGYDFLELERLLIQKDSEQTDYNAFKDTDKEVIHREFERLRVIMQNRNYILQNT